MPRPGQTANRKRKAAEAAHAPQYNDGSVPSVEPADADESADEQATSYAQVLPVAILGDDWDGRVLDGATYLGVASRENAKLPSFKRVHNPYQVLADQDSARHPTSSYGVPEVLSNRDPGPSTTRHPALPKESWEVLFPIHYVNYKKYILADWPPSPLPPYPSDYPRIPNVHDRLDLMYFINGYPRARIRLEERSEEEMMNLIPRQPVKDQGGQVPGASGAGDRSAYGQEPEGSRHKKRDPVIAVLGRLSNSDVLVALSRITKVLAYSLDHVSSILQLPTLHEQYATLLPTQPQSPDSSSSSRSSPLASHHHLPSDPDTVSPARVMSHKTPDPLSSHVAKWIFALLLIVDEYLPAQDLSTLRELARVVMRIAAWRWIHGVQTGEVHEGHVLGETQKSRRESLHRNASSSKQWLFDSGAAGGDDRQNAEDETSVDAVLSRCWLIVYAVAHGWGQKDLLDDLQGMFT